MGRKRRIKCQGDICPYFIRVSERPFSTAKEKNRETEKAVFG